MGESRNIKLSENKGQQNIHPKQHSPEREMQNLSLDSTYESVCSGIVWYCKAVARILIVSKMIRD